MQIDLNVNTKRFKCHISLKDKLTIIVGDSGEGKSTLVNKLESSYEGIVISEDYVPVILTSNLFYAFKRKYDRQQKYSSLKEFWSVDGNFPIEHSIIILDDNDIIKSEEFKIFFEVSKTNYFLVINRNSKLKIPCDVKSIYKLVSEGIEHKLVSIYGITHKEELYADVVLVEDSGSGYMFFKNLINKSTVLNASYGCRDGVVSGKDNIVNVLSLLDKEFTGKIVLLLVDYVAFGSNINDIFVLSKTLKIKIRLFLKYQSFEYLLLRSKLVNDLELDNYLQDNILKFSSKEILYTKRLQDVTKDKNYRYYKSSSKFPKCYYENCCHLQDACRFKDNKLCRNDKFKFLLQDTEFECLLKLRD